MEITLNHKSTFFENPPSSLEVLILEQTQGKTQGVAVAVNKQVIPKSQWASTSLQDRDDILIITATQGG